MIAWGGQPFGAATGAAIAATTDVPTAYVVAAAIMLISGIGAAVALRDRRPAIHDLLLMRNASQ